MAKRETTADRIIANLTRRGEATDAEMARDLDLPEASVRRTRHLLEAQGKVFCQSYTIPMTWGLQPNTKTALADPEEAYQDEDPFQDDDADYDTGY